jgi:hypothetical protein
MAIFRPAFAPRLYSSSNLIEPFAPPVFVLASKVPASCHLQVEQQSQVACECMQGGSCLFPCLATGDPNKRNLV